jgi:hypothetical protein
MLAPRPIGDKATCHADAYYFCTDCICLKDQLLTAEYDASYVNYVVAAEEYYLCRENYDFIVLIFLAMAKKMAVVMKSCEVPETETDINYCYYYYYYYYYGETHRPFS